MSQPSIKQVSTTWIHTLGLLTAIAGMSISGHALAQTFNSGSNGSDGAFDLTGRPSGTVVEFDPKTLGIDRDGDGVFHFTTITIPAGVTVHLSAKYMNGPAYWLASGAVNIAGIVNLSGEAGHSMTLSTATRKPSMPGPGGFPGGIGGNYDSTTSPGVAQPGAGPGGGAANLGSYINGYYVGLGATLAGNNFLVPLIGGSGGGGGTTGTFSWWGGGGGSGGGALLVSSSVSVTVTGQILAVGGAGGQGESTSSCAYRMGGGGGGGSIRLVAPILLGGGTLNANGGGACNGGAAGRVRLEAFQQNWTYSITGNYTTGSPLNSFVPTTPPPSLQVIGVAGVSVKADPTGSFDTADVIINTNAATEVTIRGKYIPVGTIPTLYLFSLEGKDQVLPTTALAGTYEESTSTAQVLFPAGFTRGYVRAKWTVTQ